MPAMGLNVCAGAGPAPHGATRDGAQHSASPAANQLHALANVLRPHDPTDDRTWRAMLRAWDPVEVWSRSSQCWCVGTVRTAGPDDVEVQYLHNGRPLEKPVC